MRSITLVSNSAIDQLSVAWPDIDCQITGASTLAAKTAALIEAKTACQYRSVAALRWRKLRLAASWRLRLASNGAAKPPVHGGGGCW